MPEPFLADADLTLYQGDALAVLRELPDESVHMAVTSPPYWGLRDYGTAEWEGGAPNCDHKQPVSFKSSTLGANSGGRSEETHKRNIEAQAQPYRVACAKCGAVRTDSQLGLEPTPELYVEKMVEVFREVRRVLRKDGTCWLNVGDSYASGSTYNGEQTMAAERGWKQDGPRRPNVVAAKAGLKQKDLCLIPFHLAIALQADGWWVRSDVIWNKPNPMPESVTDRPTKAHEYLFLLAKSIHYYYDQEAVREAFETRPQQRLTSTADQPGGVGRAAVGGQNPECQGGTDLRHPPPQVETLGDLPGEAPRGADGRRKTTRVEHHEGRQAHENYENAYGGERWPGGGRNMRSVWTIPTQPYPGAHFAVFPEELVRRCILAGSPIGGTVLDPFGGSGTTAFVARAHGRRALLIELSEDYCSLIEKRTHQLSLLGDEAA